MAISKSLKQEIKTKVNIVELAKEYFNLEKKGRHYQIVSDDGHLDSVVIYPLTNSFYRNSNGKGGDVILFVQETEIEGITTFQEAVKFLRGRIDPNFKVVLTKASERKIEGLELHENLLSQINEDSTNKHVIAYLIQTRKINKEIVYDALDRGMIKQEKNKDGYISAVFIGRNKQGLISCVCKRSVRQDNSFKADLRNCNYNVGWFYRPKEILFNPDKPLYCFESYIDMLSYMTLLKQNGLNIDDNYYLSCGSVTKARAIRGTIKDYGIKNIILAFDNDDAGINAMNKLRDEITPNGINVGIIISHSKDWNQDLVSGTYKLPDIEDRIQSLDKKKSPSETLQILDKTISVER